MKPFKNIFKLIMPDKSMYDDWANNKTVEGMGFNIDRLPNPDVILRKSGKGISVLRTLLNHYQVGTCVDSRKAGALSTPFEIKRGNCDKKIYDFFIELFNNLDIYKLIEDILDAPLYGYNPIEISYEKEGGYIYPVKLTAKPLEWFYFNSDNEFFFKDRFKGGKRKIDLLNGFKFLLPRHKADYLNPYGLAILSRCFWNVAFINGGFELWVKFSEKYGMPYMFGKYDRSMTDIEKKGFLEALCNMVSDAIGVIPSDGSVEIVPTGSNSNSEIYKTLIDKCEQNIAKSILGQTLSTDIGSTGSYAATASHMQVRADIIEADKRLVIQTINKFIKIVNEINFKSDISPVFDFIEEEDLGINKAERDLKVHSLGVNFTKDYLIKTYNYKEEDIELINSNNLEFQDTEDKNIKPEDKTILNDFKTVFNPMLNKVIDEFKNSRDIDEALNNLAEIYPGFNTDELEELLTKVIFIAEIKARIDTKQEEK